MLYEKPVNEFVRDFVGRTLLFKGTVQSSNPSGQMAIALEGAPDCVVFGRTYDPGSMKTGAPVYMGFGPRTSKSIRRRHQGPAGMMGGTARPRCSSESESNTKLRSTAKEKS